MAESAYPEEVNREEAALDEFNDIIKNRSDDCMPVLQRIDYEIQESALQSEQAKIGKLIVNGKGIPVAYSTESLLTLQKDALSLR